MKLLHGLNDAIDRFEPTIRLLYRLGIVAALYFGLVYVGDSLVVPDEFQGGEVSCPGTPRITS